MKPNLKNISKFLSLVLRHLPQKIDLTLDNQGWASVEELLEKMPKLNKALLEEVVEQNDKKRFSFNSDKTKIRANQGHSIPVDLGYKPVEPPPQLYHGTAQRFLGAIKKKGLIKGKRHDVHLSADWETATKVGQRHGKVVVLTIDSAKMYEEGYDFFLSENEVWLCAHVPAAYISFA